MGKSGKGSTVYHTRGDEIFEVYLEDLLDPVPTEVVVGRLLRIYYNFEQIITMWLFICFLGKK